MRLRRGAALTAVLSAACGASLAQQPTPAGGEQTTGGSAAPSASSQVFEPGYFRAFNPVNAADMVTRVPGFEIDDGDERRGFGATAGNVLINGVRPSSKATISEQLRRIPADTVLRVELLSGGSSGSDVRGQSRLVNVVLKPTSQAGSPVTFVVGLRHLEYSDRIGYTLQLSKSFRLSPNAEIAVDLQAPNIRGRGEIFEARRNGAGVLTLIEDQFNQPNFIGWQGSANLSWKPSATDTVRLNGLYNFSDNSTGIGVVQANGAGVLRSSTYGATLYPAVRRGEVGGDWEHAFGGGRTLKLIGLTSFTENDTDQTLDTFISTGQRVRSRRQVQTSLSRETVGRVALSAPFGATHTLEFGGEAALNSRDSSLRIDTSPCSPTEPSSCSSDETLVEEIRGEAFISDFWRASETVVVEAGFTLEASRITQSGSQAEERSFTYPKPNLAATWSPAEGGVWRASIERDIAQLDFAEFALAVNPLDDTSLVGNPTLEPEKAWKARLEWDRRFGSRAALTIGLFHDEVEDVRDLVVRDIDLTSAVDLADAVGNIDRGRRTGIELRGALPLDRIGLARGDFRFNAVAQETSLEDPLTGESRPFSSGDNANQGPRRGGAAGGPPPLSVGNRDWGYVMSVRQELPPIKSAWSVSLAQNSERREFRLNEEVVIDRPDPRLDVNFETTALAGLNIRFGVGNIFSPQEIRKRTFFAPDRTSQAISETRRRTNKGGPDGTMTYSVQVSGKF